MKNRFLLIIFLGFISFSSHAQCLNCTIDETVHASTGDQDFGLTPEVVTIQAGVDTSISFQFLLPRRYDSGIIGVVDIDEVQILDVLNIPPATSSFCWKSDQDANNNRYFPQTYRFGCVNMSINTLAPPGTYTVNVSLEGQAVGQAAALSIPITVIVTAPSGNPYFEMSSDAGCDSIDVTFESLVTSSNPVLFPVDYLWDFGNGNLDTGIIVNYNFIGAGLYEVEQTMITNELILTNLNANVNGSWFAGTGDDGGVFGIGASDADVEVAIASGSNNDSGSEQSDNNSPSWDFSSDPMVLGDVSVALTFTENDLIGSDNGGTYTFTVSGPGTYNFGNGGTNMSGVVTIVQREQSRVVTLDTVNVFPTPIAPSLISLSGSSIFCNGDTITLECSLSDSYQWFKDNVSISGATNQTLDITEPGIYAVQVLDLGSICYSEFASLQINVDSVPTPVIEFNSTDGFYVDNPNSYSVQWYANGSGISIPIPGANLDTLATFNSNNQPFTVDFISSNGCTSISAPYEICVGGTSSASVTELFLGDSVTFTSNGFVLNSSTNVAWAISNNADGSIEDEVSLQAAIDAGLVLPGDSNGLTVDCSDLPSGLGNGDYYFTPFSVLSFEQGCIPDGNFCLEITGTDWAILGSSLTFTFPDGSVVAVLDELVPDEFQNLIPDTITPAILALLPTLLPDGLCFNLSDLFVGDPNGDWSVSAQNVGTGDVVVTVPQFQVGVYDSLCTSITSDDVVTIDEITGTITPNSTSSLTISVNANVYSATFPTLSTDCNVFGEATLLSINCATAINDVVDINSLNLYPNPNNGNFTVALNVLERSAVQLQIVDITGRSIVNTSYPSILGNFKETFNLGNNMSPGFYVLNMQIGENQIQKHFIVK